MNCLGVVLNLLHVHQGGQIRHAARLHAGVGVILRDLKILNKVKGVHAAIIRGEVRLHVQQNDIRLARLLNDHIAGFREGSVPVRQLVVVLAAAGKGSDENLLAGFLQRQNVIVVLQQNQRLRGHFERQRFHLGRISLFGSQTGLQILIGILKAVGFQQRHHVLGRCAGQGFFLNHALAVRLKRQRIINRLAPPVADDVGTSVIHQSDTLKGRQLFHTPRNIEQNVAVRVDEALKAHRIAQQGLQEGRIIGGRDRIRIDVHAAVGLVGIDGHGTAVAGHDARRLAVNRRLEAGQEVLFHGVFRAVHAPLTRLVVRLEAVIGSAVAGEVLDDQANAVRLQAVGAALIAFDQRGRDVRHHRGILGERCHVASPARVGNQVDLTAIHTIQPLRVPNLAIQIREAFNQAVVAAVGNVAHHRRRQTHGAGFAGELLGVGNEGERNAGFACRRSGVFGRQVRVVVQHARAHVRHHADNAHAIVEGDDFRR